MSITFQPSQNYDNFDKIHDQLSWDCYFFIKNYKQFYDKYPGEDVEQMCWSKGHQPLEFWNALANKYDMVMVEDHKSNKLYIDSDHADDPMKGDYGMRITATKKDAINLELQIANANAQTLCMLLKIDPESGNMNPYALLKKIEQVDWKSLTEFTKDYSDTQEEGRPRIIDFGLDIHKLKQYFIKLEEICDYCIKQELDINWG